MAVSLRLDPEIVARFKASGPGWQTRMNDALREAAGL
ncbi:BrnA antitoxin family protein [Thalassococcus profundi]|nr:BrnA antitoxin family protein [Thalassococcus profundi]